VLKYRQMNQSGIFDQTVNIQNRPPLRDERQGVTLNFRYGQGAHPRFNKQYTVWSSDVARHCIQKYLDDVGLFDEFTDDLDAALQTFTFKLNFDYTVPIGSWPNIDVRSKWYGINHFNTGPPAGPIPAQIVDLVR
jgi:hypothetical protein